MQPAPIRVLTMGLHGSASTWVYNVARELLLANYGEAAVHSCFTIRGEGLRDTPGATAQHVVAKTHGWPALAEFASEWDAKLIVSVRDPRDAVVSLMQRFGETFDRSVRGIGQDCRVAFGCARARFPVLRYEDRFFEKPAAVEWIARHLGVAAAPAIRARIFAAYTTDRVRQFAAGVTALPPERQRGNESFRFDSVTQITNSHIGDGRVGKWREVLDPGQGALLTTHFRPFLAAFGYSEAPEAGATSGPA